MPIKIRKLPNKQLYRVYNADTGEIYAKATTNEKAIHQKNTGISTTISMT